MKKVLLFCGGLLVAATLIFVSCKKDKVTPTVNNYFSVENAVLIEKNMPEPTMEEQIAVVMNGNVISGGTSLVRINSERVAKKILVGMKDQDGYYELTPSTRGEYTFLMLVNQNITLEEGENGFSIQVAIEDENGDISQIWENTVTLIAVGTGNLQVSLSFDNAKDVDLILVEPNGEKIGYFNEISENGGELDLDSNAGCWIDNVNNENITYGDSAYVEPGLYKVYVDLYENCDPTIATNFVVTVLYQGAPIAVTSGSNPFSGTYPVDAPSNFTDLDNIEPVITFEIPGTGQKRMKSFAPVPMSETAKAKWTNSALNK